MSPQHVIHQLFFKLMAGSPTPLTSWLHVEGSRDYCGFSYIHTQGVNLKMCSNTIPLYFIRQYADSWEFKVKSTLQNINASIIVPYRHWTPIK